LPFDEVRLALLVRKTRKTHDPRKVVHLRVRAGQRDDSFLKITEFVKLDSVHLPVGMKPARAGAADPTGGERNVPGILKMGTIQIRKQHADSGNVVCRAAPEIRLVDTDEYPGAPLRQTAQVIPRAVDACMEHAGQFRPLVRSVIECLEGESGGFGVDDF
jgi:hypothetical protein